MRVLDTIVVGPLEMNCYLVGEPQVFCMIVDAGADRERIETAIEKQGAHVQAIVCTHGHYDHIGAVAKLKEKYKVPVYMHEAEKEVLESMFRKFNVERFGVDHWMKDEDEIPNSKFKISNKSQARLEFEDWNLKFLHTPGHTPGSVCLVADMFVITGDTVFADGYLGRTDFPGGSDLQMQQSLKKVMSLPENLLVYPGHGPSSTIGREKKLHGIQS